MHHLLGLLAMLGAERELRSLPTLPPQSVKETEK